MKLSIKAGATSQALLIFVQDSTSTTGAGLTGLAYGTSGLTCYYARPGFTAAAVTLVTQTVTGTYSSGGFVEISATNMPGWYRFDPPDAALAAGVRSVGFHLKGAANMAPLPFEVELTAWDNQDQVITAVGAATIADKLLGRSIIGGADGGRTVKQVMQFQRNAWSISGTTLTVMAEDDTTPAWTATLTFSAGGLVTGFNPD